MTQTKDYPDWLSAYLEAHPQQWDASDPSQDKDGAWATLFARLSSLSSSEMNLRAGEIKRLLDNAGMTATLGDEDSWHLDPLPLMVSSKDWRQLQTGVQQRVRLFNDVLRDLYGDRRLLSKRGIDPLRLQSNAVFNRECFTLGGDAPQLSLYAVDVYRDSNGEFKVYADHCQSPDGLGLLLENRVISRRVLSEEFAECGVQRLVDYFKSLQQMIVASLPTISDPRVVLWTPGPSHPLYTEHAFLASYLGYTLVRSSDLTVRNGKLWLKTLAGLRKIDAVLRWIKDPYLDSLEQVDYSVDGVPGLLQVLRTGQVKLFNTAGTGVLESAVVKRTMAQLAESTVEERLLLGEPNTLDVDDWDGTEIGAWQLRSYNDSQFVICGENDPEAFQAALAEGRQDYYLQERPDAAAAPFWEDNALNAKPIMLRLYAIVSGREVQVMPSALAWAYRCDAPRLTMASTVVKDTWVLNDIAASDIPSLAKQLRGGRDIALVEGDIPSRTAENLYWLGRYVERVENTVRLLRVFVERYTELAIYPDADNRQAVERILHGIEKQQLIYPFNDIAFGECDTGLANSKRAALRLLQDTNIPGSLASVLNSMFYSAIQVRDLLSLDSWRIVEDVERILGKIKNLSLFSASRTIQATADQVMGLAMAFNGSITDTMSNSNGGFMMEIGRRVERSTQLVKASRALFSNSLDELAELTLLESLLSSQVSMITHKRRYRMYQSIETGLELMLLDGEYPRSLLYQIKRLMRLSYYLPGRKTPGFMAPHERLLLHARTELSLPRRDELTVENEEGARPHLITLLDTVARDLDAFGDTLLVDYFAHTKAARRLRWSDTSDVAEESSDEV